MQSTKINRLGLDIGSLYIKAVLLQDSDIVPLQRYFKLHSGDFPKNIHEIFFNFGVINSQVHLGVTGANADLFSALVEPVNPIKALRIAVLKKFPEVRNIIDVGGCSATLIHLKENGELASYVTNSLCAAGTGSFLDHQAERLGISYDNLSRISQIEDPPIIATRCAVFAKSDLIHRQQEGYSKEELWSGLCKGTTNTMILNLLGGKKLDGPTVFTGGVALNSEILKWLKKKFGDTVLFYPDPAFAQAIGSALAAHDPPVVIPEHVIINNKAISHTTGRRPRLALYKSTYPDFTAREEWVDNVNNEIRILKPCAPQVPGYLGIDIGSTSTKLVFIDEEEDVVFDIYRKTSGDPVGAILKLFKAFKKIEQLKKVKCKILGSCTTGSGRKLVGKLIGADLIVNEITAHTAGALKTDPEIETIFEIGGQDSKYIHLKKGKMSQCNMNYVCAAGTGSFIEEHANKLGFSIQEVGDRVLEISPPPSSDRCTVFMEKDVNNLLLRGYGKEEVLAAVIYSIAQNYITRVVGTRPVSRKKIFFQGATARNKALVAAFESILDREIVVSPLCHIMGSFGAALLVKRQQNKVTNFRGIELQEKKISLKYEHCEICTNHCKITFAHIGDEKGSPSWGYMCGKDPEENKRRKIYGYTSFKKRNTILKKMGNVRVQNPIATLGIPRTLTNLSFLPLWKKFLGELGFRTILSEQTNDKIIEKGIESSGSDFCFPIKVAHGHIHHLLTSDKIDKVFLPHFMSVVPEKSSYSRGVLCPYVQSIASIVKKAFNAEILSPVVDFRWKESKLLSHLHNEIGKPYGISKKKVYNAWNKAITVQKEFFRVIQEEGEKIIERSEGKGIIIIGRPYNTLDDKISSNIPFKFAEKFDVTVIPADMVPYNPGEINSDFKMFWNYGKIILNDLMFIRNNPNWYGVFLSNFNCGPDSFLLNYAEEIVGDKPFLTLELDEHGSDGGYQTRMEAFMDAVNSYTAHSYKKLDFTIRNRNYELKNRTIWIPPMHPVGTPLFAAGFMRYGYDAQELPEETPEILEFSKSMVRGNECLPSSTIIGNFIKKLKEIDAKPEKHALFSVTADGPCRLGQYIVLHRLILNRMGYQDVPIIAPSSNSNYNDLPGELPAFFLKIILMADSIYKARCRIKPYEKKEGETEKVLEAGIQIMKRAISQGDDIYSTFRETIESFKKIEITREIKPLVGVVGEIYIRCNLFSNDHLIRAIEDAGGEAWLSPISEWILYTGFMTKWHFKHCGNMRDRLIASLKNNFFHKEERKIDGLAFDLLHDRMEPDIKKIIEKGAEFVPTNFGTEAILTLGRALMFVEQGARLIVNTAPFSCMPGNITSAIFNHIQTEMGTPVVNIFYDGISDESSMIKTYIENLH